MLGINKVTSIAKKAVTVIDNKTIASASKTTAKNPFATAKLTQKPQE